MVTTVAMVAYFPSSLPELMERKKSIDMHTNMATALLDEIKVGVVIDGKAFVVKADVVRLVCGRPGSLTCFLRWRTN